MEEYQVSHLPGAMQVDPQEECSIDTLGITPDSKSDYLNATSYLCVLIFILQLYAIAQLVIAHPWWHKNCLVGTRRKQCQ